MNVETIYSEQGNAVLKTLNGSMVDYLNTSLKNIDATSITLDVTGGSIGAVNNLLDIDQDASGVPTPRRPSMCIWRRRSAICAWRRSRRPPAMCC